MENNTQYEIVNGQLQVTTLVQDTKVNTYDIDTLLKNRDAIQKSKDDFDAARDAELVSVNVLIAAARAAGLTSSQE